MRGRALGPGRLYKRGGAWTLDWRGADGKRVHQALSHDRRTAERIRSELVHRRDLELAGLGGEAGMASPFSELVAAYLADLKPRVVERHHAQVAARLARVVAKLPDIRVRDLRLTTITSLRAEAISAGCGNRSSNLVADSVCACLRWGTESGLIAANPLARLKRLPEAGHERRRRRALSEDEIARMLAAADADDRRCAGRFEVEERVRIPQRPLFQFLVETGARFGEARLLTWGAVDLANRLVVFRAQTTKTRRQRAIPIRVEVAEGLRALQALHARALGRLPTSNEPVFLSPDGAPWGRPTTNIGRILHRVLRRAGIVRVDAEGQRVDVHALRHTCATRLARRGVGLAVTQRMLGHADPKLTARVYTHLGTEDLRAAVDGVRAMGAPQRAAESA
jgi:integrase